MVANLNLQSNTNPNQQYSNKKELGKSPNQVHMVDIFQNFSEEISLLSQPLMMAVNLRSIQNWQCLIKQVELILQRGPYQITVWPQDHPHKAKARSTGLGMLVPKDELHRH